MTTKNILVLTAIVMALASVPAFAGGKATGGARRATNVCPVGTIPGSGLCGGAGAVTCDGTRQHLRLHDGSCVAPNGTMEADPIPSGTPLRDGSGKAVAPGKGAKDGTGNQPRHPTSSPAPR